MSTGRVAITARALESVARAVAAKELAVEASAVTIRLADASGRLALRVESPIRLSETGAGLMTSVENARTAIARDVSLITGSQLASVDLRITGAATMKGPRVS